MRYKLRELGVLALIGGIIYGLIEFFSRGYTHWSMVILGGICFVAVGLINEILPWEMPILVQMICGGIIITTLEFITGVVINIQLGWAVWDYSQEQFNVLGQICPKYSLLWVLLSGVAIILDDYLRYWIFGDDKPKYKFLGW